MDLKVAFGINGIFKKIFTIVLIAVLHQIDITFNSNAFAMNAGIISFMIFELVSIIENAGLMGITVPPIFNKIIDTLNQKIKDGEN